MTDPVAAETVALSAGIREALRTCGETADGYRDMATALRAIAGHLRILNGTQVFDPSDHGKRKPDVLRSLDATERGKTLANVIESMSIDMYGRAGVWDAEMEDYARMVSEYGLDTLPA